MDKCFVLAREILQKENILSLVIPAYNHSLSNHNRNKNKNMQANKEAQNMSYNIFV